jgi:hypothetical protein
MAVPGPIAQQTIALLRQAAQQALQTPGRTGTLLELTPTLAEEVIFTGDLHGERLNFKRICRMADLANHPHRHLVLQEVCHGGPTYPDGNGCMSHLLLEDIAALVLEFPGRVHFLLGNHEWAELVDYPIRKGLAFLNYQFWEGITTFYGDDSWSVRDAYREFLGSSLLAISLSNGVFASHSAPPRGAPCLDRDRLRQPLEKLDLSSGGEVYHLLWGRDYHHQAAERFAQAVGASVLVHGHEPCDGGFATPNNWQIILDGSHPRAHVLSVRLEEPASHDILKQRVQPLHGALLPRP